MTTYLGMAEAGLYLCEPGSPLRDVLARLDAAKGLGQVVVNADKRLLGVVTDGDVRRALLAKATLDMPVEAVMNRDPVVGRSSDVAGQHAMLRRVAARRSILPIVDQDDRCVGLLLGDDLAGGSIMTGLVMAGGFGKRLGAKTAKVPKPLIEVGGLPLLEHALRRLEAGGVGRVFLATHYLGEQIEAFAAARQGKARLSILREDLPLGTAGAVGLLPPDVDGPLLVMNADLITEVDIARFVEFWQRNDFDGVVAVTTHEVAIDFGVVRHDEAGLFRGIDEKPKVRHFVAAGLYLLGPSIRVQAKPLERLDMPELLNRAHGAGARIGLFPLHEYWRDVGRPDDLAAVRLEHAEGA